MNYTKTTAFLLLVLLAIQAEAREQSCISKAIRKKYCNSDYIVVGVGTAGAAVCNQLTNDNETSVLAIHSGENLTQNRLIKFSAFAPLVVASALVGSSFFETGDSVPQPNADDRELLWAIGLPEGGASSINAMAYVRGTNRNFAQWEALAGPNWAVDRMLGIYKELEDYKGQTPNPEFRGFNGPLEVRQVTQPTALSLKFTQAIINAAVPAGVPTFPNSNVVDYNDPLTPIGASSQLQYTQTGPGGIFRESSANAFLNESVITPDGFGVNGRKLRVLFEATGLKVLWSGNTAIGVEYIQDGEIQQAFASKGVIVTAGLNSSSFILHSGVGPRALLESLNIPVIADNPLVGQGLVDQYFVPILFSTNVADTPFPPIDPNSVFSQIAWLPDPIGIPTERSFHFATANPFPGVALTLFSLCNTKSTGSVTINSADPLDPIVVNLGLFNNPEDLSLFQRGLQDWVANIVTQLQIIDPAYQLVFPDTAVLADPILSAEFIKAFVSSNQCFQSQCRIAQTMANGVADPNGKVFGTKKLYVADASAAPFNLDATPMAPAYLIGTNIAKLLLNQ